jgi:hypothetical protein
MPFCVDMSMNFLKNGHIILSNKYNLQKQKFQVEMTEMAKIECFLTKRIEKLSEVIFIIHQLLPRKTKHFLSYH